MRVSEFKVIRVVTFASLLVMATPALTGYCQESERALSQFEKNWPRFRGPGGLGVIQDANIPSSWNGKTGDGILWKTPVPLPGMSSPVVWENHIFLTGASDQAREVFCFEANSGTLLWRRPVDNVPSSKPPPDDISEDTGHAAPTAATDGQRVFTIFANGDLVCFDFNGERLWARSLGPLENMYGHASSLVVYRHLLLIQLDQARAEDGLSELIAIDTASGEIAWRRRRPVANAWTTPIVVHTGERHELITCANPFVMAYDPVNGEELWRAKCLGGDVASSPVFFDGLVYAIYAYESLIAIRPGGTGDVTNTHVAWKAEGVMPDICSPVTNGDLLFALETEGILSCYDAGNGEKIWEEDLANNFIASPSLVSDKVYLMAEDGTMVILNAARTYKLLGKAELGEGAKASPAFHNGRIYIRGFKHLYCIAQ